MLRLHTLAPRRCRGLAGGLLGATLKWSLGVLVYGIIMMRWLGIDHGSRRIGLAVGDTAGGIATPLEVLPADPVEHVLRRIVELAGQYQAAGAVVGWPLNMDGTEGPQARLARDMALRLRQAAPTLDVRLWDERLSSFQADQDLAGHLTRAQKKARQDAVAAAVMLQDFLARGGPDAATTPDAPPPTKD